MQKIIFEVQICGKIMANVTQRKTKDSVTRHNENFLRPNMLIIAGFKWQQFGTENAKTLSAFFSKVNRNSGNQI